MTKKSKGKQLLLVIVVIAIIGIIWLMMTKNSSLDTTATTEDSSQPSPQRKTERSKELSKINPSSPSYNKEILSFFETFGGAIIGDWAANTMLIKGVTTLVSNTSFLKSSRMIVKLGRTIGMSKLGWALGLQKGIITAEEVGGVALGKAAVKAVLEPALLAFSIISQIVDVADPAQYNKLQYKSTYIEMRDQLIESMKESLKQNNISYPLIIGPLTKIMIESDKKFNGLLSDKFVSILPECGKPVWDAIKNDLISKKIMPNDIQDPKVFESYITKYLDQEGCMKTALRLLCEEYNGKVVTDPNDPSQFYCSYKDKNLCDSSYTWPLNETKNEMYVEYKKDMLGGVCIFANPSIRNMCDQNGLDYDEDLGICKIDEAYCKKYGADWVTNSDIGEFDCSISLGQNIIEMIIGVTLTRKLKDLFDFGGCASTEDGFFDIWKQKCFTCNDTDGTKGHRNWNKDGSGIECSLECKDGYGTDLISGNCWKLINPADKYSFLRPMREITPKARGIDINKSKVNDVSNLYGVF